MSGYVTLHHVAVVVTDVAEAKKFYMDLFQLQERVRLTTKVSSHGGAWFQLGNLELHLQERKQPEQKSEQHFALTSDHYEEILAKAISMGAKIEDAKLVEGFDRRVFLHDPDGNRIELLRMARG